MTEKPDAPAHGSESENPAIDSPTPTTDNPRTNKDWWPNQLDLQILKKHANTTTPMDVDYAAAFETLDVEALKADLVALMTPRRTGGPPTSATTADCSSALRKSFISRNIVTPADGET